MFFENLSLISIFGYVLVLVKKELHNNTMVNDAQLLVVV